MFFFFFKITREIVPENAKVIFKQKYKTTGSLFWYKEAYPWTAVECNCCTQRRLNSPFTFQNAQMPIRFDVLYQQVHFRSLCSFSSSPDFFAMPLFCSPSLMCVKYLARVSSLAGRIWWSRCRRERRALCSPVLWPQPLSSGCRRERISYCPSDTPGSTQTRRSTVSMLSRGTAFRKGFLEW